MPAPRGNRPASYSVTPRRKFARAAATSGVVLAGGRRRSARSAGEATSATENAPIQMAARIRDPRDGIRGVRPGGLQRSRGRGRGSRGGARRRTRTRGCGAERRARARVATRVESRRGDGRCDGACAALCARPSRDVEVCGVGRRGRRVQPVRMACGRSCVGRRVRGRGTGAGALLPCASAAAVRVAVHVAATIRALPRLPSRDGATVRDGRDRVATPRGESEWPGSRRRGGGAVSPDGGRAAKRDPGADDHDERRDAETGDRPERRIWPREATGSSMITALRLRQRLAGEIAREIDRRVLGRASSVGAALFTRSDGASGAARLTSATGRRGLHRFVRRNRFEQRRSDVIVGATPTGGRSRGHRCRERIEHRGAGCVGRRIRRDRLEQSEPK